MAPKYEEKKTKQQLIVSECRRVPLKRQNDTEMKLKLLCKTDKKESHPAFSATRTAAPLSRDDCAPREA